jgi:hypothetical protein
MRHHDPADDALDVAISRTQAAQNDVARVIEADAVPEPAHVERVERRAEDLEELAHSAAEAAAKQTSPGRDADQGADGTD